MPYKEAHSWPRQHESMDQSIYERIRINRGHVARLEEWNSDSKYFPDLQGQFDPFWDHRKLA